MIEVVPAIIPENFKHLCGEVEKVVPFVSRVQVDVMDGKFAPTTTWPYNGRDELTFEKLVKKEETLPHVKSLIYELDMLVEKPEEHIDKWMAAGIKSLIIHIESTNELQSIIERAKEKYVEVGIALNPSTRVELLDPWIDQVDSADSPQVAFVQFMGNDKIGYHGVSLDSFVLPHITRLRKKHPALIISIDIGVTEETAPILVEAGVSRLVSGSAIFNSENIEETIKTFQSLSVSL